LFFFFFSFFLFFFFFFFGFHLDLERKAATRSEISQGCLCKGTVHFTGFG
jgi:hypothetical protein